MKKSIALLVFALSLIAGGCERKPAQEAVPVPTEEPAAATQAAPNFQLPEPKEITYTAEEKLGTLAENVGIAVGSQAPEFELAGSDGASVKLSDLLAKGPTVVFFYRGGWCPYCNFQVREFQASQPAFAESGIQLVGISVDRPEAAVAMKGAYRLSYPVLSDPDLAAHRAFNVAVTPDAATLEELKGYGIDLALWSGRDHNTFAVPGVFVLDRSGTVRWAHTDLEYQVRPSAVAVLGAAKSALGEEPTAPAADETSPAGEPAQQQ